MNTFFPGMIFGVLLHAIVQISISFASRFVKARLAINCPHTNWTRKSILGQRSHRCDECGICTQEGKFAGFDDLTAIPTKRTDMENQRRQEMADQSAIDINIGDALEGGYFAGFLLVGGRRAALIVAPKAEGEHKSTQLLASSKKLPDAFSFDDGAANTIALMEAGSGLAKWSRGLNIGGFSDWYIPSLDELELLYRGFKPTTYPNWRNRSGVNASAIPPTQSYSKSAPLQTVAPAFQEGGAEALLEDWYWTSTVHADGDAAWYQDFTNGGQDGYGAYYELRARAVRRSFL